jgi:hypothetical protein
VYLEELGAEVDLVETTQLSAFKSEHGVPDGAASCHTAITGGYVLEGHVPAGAILQLLEERPEGIGIALPGMPADSPGMGGDPQTWESQPVVLIGSDGSFTPFDY